MCGRWAWFGALAALGLLGKYTTALLLLPLLLLAVLHPRLRRVWAGPGPWLALAVALLLLLPHLLGLWRIDFTPLWFPFERAPGPSHWYDHIVNPLLFAVAQFGDIAAVLLALALLAWRRRGEPLAMPRRPLAAGATRLAGDHHLGAGRSRGCRLVRPRPAPEGYVGLPDVVLHRPVPDGRGSGAFYAGGLQRFALAWLIILVTVPVVFTVQQTIGGRFMRKPLRAAFPGPELARVVEQRWHAVSATPPLAIVAGDVWLAGNIAFYGADRPSVFIDADPAKSPWITPDALARQGAVLIWPASDAPPAG